VSVTKTASSVKSAAMAAASFLLTASLYFLLYGKLNNRPQSSSAPGQNLGALFLLFSAVSETAREAAAIVMSASDTNRVGPVSLAPGNRVDLLFAPQQVPDSSRQLLECQLQR
jgi:hypothetical protein